MNIQLNIVIVNELRKINLHWKPRENYMSGKHII